jgi:predicted DNA-binding protein
MRILKKKPIQIYLEPQQNNVLEDISKKRGISKAAIIRESVEMYLDKLPVEEDAALGIVGLGRSGKGDLSDKHDRYIAGYARTRGK